MANEPEPTATPTPDNSDSSSDPATWQPGARASFEIHQEFVSGPIPPPEVLAHYQGVNQSFPERIMAMAERQLEHRHTVEVTALNAQIQQASENRAIRRRGQTFGFAIAMAFLGGTIITAYIGQPTVAGILGGSTVVSLAVVFVVGRSKDRPRTTHPSQTNSPH